MPKEAIARARAVEVEEEEDDDFRKRAQINRKEKQDRGLFKLPEGPTIFRVLKTPADKQRSSPSVWIEYYVHRAVGPKKVGPLRCGLSVVDDSGSCWLCSVVEKLKEKGKTLAASEIERKKAYAIQVAVMDDTLGGLRGPLLWVMSSGKSSRSLSYKLETIIAAPASKGYVDHENGYNFTIDRTGMTMTDTTYGAPERADERTEVPKPILTKLKPFVDVLNPYDKEGQKKAFYGENEVVREEEPRRKSRVEEDEEEDEPVKPKAKAKKIEDDDEEDSIDTDPEVDDDEEDDPPPPAKDADEDDEDLQFGDEDEDDEVTTADEDDEPVRPVVKPKKRR